MNNLPRVVARIVPRSESNLRPLDHESSALTTTPPSHQVSFWGSSAVVFWGLGARCCMVKVVFSRLVVSTGMGSLPNFE